MSWVFGLTDLDGVSIGRLHWASERNLALPLNGIQTARFTLRLDDPMAGAISDVDGDCLLKVYQDSVLRFIGELTTMEEVGGEGQTLACNFVGPLWRLQKRLCGKSVAGTTYPDKPRGDIILGDLTALPDPASLLYAANAEKDTGIRQGTVATVPKVTAGPWSYKPVAEAITELVSLTWPPYAARDTYLQAGGFLTGQSAAVGGVYAGYQPGGSGDYYVGDDETLWRDANFANGTARLERLTSVALANLVAGIDFYFGEVTDSTGLEQGLVVRDNGSTNPLTHNNLTIRALPAYFGAQPGDVTVVQVIKHVNGTPTVLAEPAVLLGAGFWYSIKISVDATGYWELWLVQRGVPIGVTPPLATGTDSAFATAGTHATGCVGVYDSFNSAESCARQYDNLYALDPDEPIVELDFDMTPSEPTADSNQSGVVGAGLKIATLNTYAPLGTVQSDVIFEYGAGNRSVKSYRHVKSRESLLTRAYSLPAEDVRVADNTTAIDSLGLYEEVVSSDVADGELRQALINAHIAVRARARSIVTFDPSQTAPVFGTDYIVGDWVTARAIVNSVVRFNGLVRVYGIEVSIDAEGKEEVTLTLVAE